MRLFLKTYETLCYRMWIIPESKDMPRPSVSTEAERLKLISEGCDPKTVSVMCFCLIHFSQFWFEYVQVLIGVFLF